jgi:short-subunit dehydrogenase
MIIKNILLTGASSGIGEALALHYAKLPTTENIFICGRNEERLNAVKEACLANGKAKIHATVLDVSNKEAVATWIEQSEETAPLNLVFANAGVATTKETAENIFNTFNINVMGVINTIIPAIEIYKKRKDKDKIIAITSSIAGYHGLSSCPSYSASKACVKAYGEALRLQLLRYNIQVNTICPGFIRSRITDKNKCPMPFFMETEPAAALIAHRIEKNVGLIAFPWPMRFATWLLSILPNVVSDFIYKHLPHKV